VSLTGGDPKDSMLFSEEDLCPWLAEWQNMPDFTHVDLAPKFSIVVNFATAADAEDFGRAIGQEIRVAKGRQAQSYWYPEQEIGRMVNKRYIEVKP
jgi:hypothetical protein